MTRQDNTLTEEKTSSKLENINLFMHTITMLTRKFLKSCLSKIPFIFILDYILNNQWDHLESYQNFLLIYLITHKSLQKCLNLNTCFSYTLGLRVQNLTNKKEESLFKILRTKSKLAIIWKTARCSASILNILVGTHH